ncbi:hypothetical protein Mal64_25420 [Pseudobythopirellula maris]|uniref:Uncharacterized protein n=1 Tax=Pseudobythopirellula maris TaxID=2527991 RepID=A0A5C5ZPB0_9BACT|nr:hypothetical protein Mal64_25420 [Pseudobythopirellula maris]
MAPVSSRPVGNQVVLHLKSGGWRGRTREGSPRASETRFVAHGGFRCAVRPRHPGGLVRIA